MEGIDLAGVVDSDFQGIQINFAPSRPAGFANFRGAGQDLLFCEAGRTSLLFTLLVYTTHVNEQHHIMITISIIFIELDAID